MDAVKGGSRATKAANIPQTGDRLTGCACAALDGVVSAYDSYQSDSYHYPEMGRGGKIARAGITGVASTAGACSGATYGAQLGAAIDAVGGPVGISAGGVVGDTISGLGENKLGQAVGSIINNGMHSLINIGGS